MTKTIKLTAFKKKDDNMYLSSVEQIGDVVVINYSPNQKDAYLIKTKHLDSFIKEVYEVGLDICFDDFHFVSIIDTIKVR